MAAAWLYRRLVGASNPPGRWWFSARAALCLATPVAVGWALGDTTSGLAATIGGFAALYGRDRPYANRARFLAVIAIGFAVAVTVGDWAADVSWLGVLAVSAIAMVATLLCNALATGPPGAYMFVLACAAGTGVAAAHVPPWRVGLLVLAGGAFAWLVHMAGVVRGVRRPEERAVAAAADAVLRYLDALGTAAETTTRHAAAQALHGSWVALVNFQPARAGPALRRLRAANRELHVIFAEAMAAGADGSSADPHWPVRARQLGAGGEPTAPQRVPLGRPSSAQLVRRALQRPSGQRLVVARVGIAVLIAGALATVLDVERGYWAMAAAVLVLHQGFDRRRTLRRGLDRSIGTWLGLVVAGFLLAWQPQGLWLAAILAALQFTIEMLVIPIYAAAAVFITPAALLITAGARPVENLTGFLLARGVDTLIGAAVAIAVYLATARRQDIVTLSEAIASTLEAAAAVAPHLAVGAVSTPAALTARRDLQLRALDLQPAHQAATAGSRRQRAAAERLWPAVAATEDFAYRTLAACWVREQQSESKGESNWPEGELENFTAVTSRLADAVRTGSRPGALDRLPAHGGDELAVLRDSLVGD